MDSEEPLQSGFRFPVHLDGAWRMAVVAPHSLRAEGYRLLVRGAAGVQEVDPGAETTYRGMLEGEPGSVVAVSLFEGSVQGILRRGPESPWYGIQPLADVDSAARLEEHVVYSEESVLAVDGACGGAIDVLRGGGLEGALPAPDGGPGTKICQIAIDSDVEFFVSNGSSVPATQNDITTVMNAVEALYDTTAQVLYDITVIYVETGEPDPYSSTSPSTLLDQFQDHWNSQHGADARDVAHLFTGKNLSGSTIGIAYLNVICNLGQAYGLSQSKFSFSLTSRVALTAHELGHNWSASHCDGDFDCGIMCSGIGGCSGSLTSFGSAATSSILNKKASSTCLEDVPPPAPPFLTGLVPGSVQVFQGGSVTLNGFFLSEVTEVHVGPTTLTAPFGFTVVSDTQITFQAPTGSALGPVSVTAENAAGTSNGLSMTFVETNPPKLVATGVGLTGLLFQWSFASSANDLWYLFVSINNPSTVPFAGFNLLASGFLVTSGSLTPAGLGSTSVIVPPGASGATVYSQTLILDGTTFGFVGASNVFSSLILL